MVSVAYLLKRILNTSARIVIVHSCLFVSFENVLSCFLKAAKVRIIIKSLKSQSVAAW